MNYIIGGAYKSLLFALYLKNVLGEKITMITYKKDMIKFCKDQDIDYIQYEKIKIKYYSVYKIFTLKKLLDNIIKEIDINEEDRIFLTGSAKGHNYFYLAKELSKKGASVYYKGTDLESRELKRFKPPWYKPIFIRGGVIRILLKIFLDLDLIYYDSHSVPCFGITDDFLKKYNIKEYDPEHSVEDLIFKGLKTINKKFKEYDNLIMDEGPLVNIIEFDSLKQLNKKLLDLPIKFAFKKHPTTLDETEFEKKYYKIFDNCKILPRYIPVELFLKNIKKNVFSIYSTSLVTASQFDHLKAVSLLELVEWYNESFKRDVKKMLIKKSNNKILFPNSFNELKEIINEPRRR